MDRPTPPQPPAATRTLTVAPGAIPALIGRLRAEPGPRLWQWQLGDHGSVALHWFHLCPADEPTLALSTGALRDPSQRHRVDIVVTIAPLDHASCVLSLQPTGSDEWRGAHPDGFALLLRAAVDEIAEELAWFARPSRRAA